MTKKKWALLILCILLVFGWFKLFYKTYTETGVVKSADCIIALDVKRITNTIIWNIITTPSQWDFSSSVIEEGKVALDDMVKLPDYVFIFHAAGHPANAWYTVLEIKDTADFNKGLRQYHFEKDSGMLFSKELGIEVVQNGDQLLVGNLAVDDNNYIRQTANELFVKKQFVAKAILKKNIDASSHLSAQIAKNNFQLGEYLISANFDKSKIAFTTAIESKSNVNYTLHNFGYSDSSLCTLAFTQPDTGVHRLLPDSAWAGISKALNFDIDSLLRPTNTLYQLDVEGIHSRVDSAISYTYDDNFNPVEKKVVNTVEEPSFNFTVQGANVALVYNYWNDNGKLEQTAAGELFTPMPFVKAYCIKKNEKQLAVTSNNYKPLPAKQSVECILFFRLLLTKVPPSLTKYFSADLMKAIKNIGSVEILVNKEKEKIVLEATFNKKKNDLPILEW